MLPSEEQAIILQIVNAHPEGITTPEIVSEFVGDVPDYDLSFHRARVYKKLKTLEKYGQIEKAEILNTGNIWKPR